MKQELNEKLGNLMSKISDKLTDTVFLSLEDFNDKNVSLNAFFYEPGDESIVECVCHIAKMNRKSIKKYKEKGLTIQDRNNLVLEKKKVKKDSAKSNLDLSIVRILPTEEGGSIIKGYRHLSNAFDTVLDTMNDISLLLSNEKAFNDDEINYIKETFPIETSDDSVEIAMDELGSAFYALAETLDKIIATNMMDKLFDDLDKDELLDKLEDLLTDDDIDEDIEKVEKTFKDNLPSHVFAEHSDESKEIVDEVLTGENSKEEVVKWFKDIMENYTGNFVVIDGSDPSTPVLCTIDELPEPIGDFKGEEIIKNFNDLHETLLGLGFINEDSIILLYNKDFGSKAITLVYDENGKFSFASPSIIFSV